MQPTANELLCALPPFQDRWVMVKQDQGVNDIITEILITHYEFAPQYDLISDYFAGNSAQDTADNLYCFLLDNVRYKEEPDTKQTTALPAGILTRGKGDCKHYALFSCGVIASLIRKGYLRGKVGYCFASYKLTEPVPYHVFCVFKSGGTVYWIDPTPGSFGAVPVWDKIKYVN